jgi:hypothetical protein
MGEFGADSFFHLLPFDLSNGETFKEDIGVGEYFNALANLEERRQAPGMVVVAMAQKNFLDGSHVLL